MHCTWQKFETTLRVTTTVRNLTEGHEKVCGMVEGHGKRLWHNKVHGKFQSCGKKPWQGDI